MRIGLLSRQGLVFLLFSSFLVFRKYLGGIHVAFIVVVKENFFQVFLFEDRLEFALDLDRGLLLTGLGILAYFPRLDSPLKNFIRGPIMARGSEAASFCLTRQVMVGLLPRRFNRQCLSLLETAP